MTPRYDNYGWRPYVPVAKRRANAIREMKKRSKKGLKVEPIERMSGRAIAKTFWGKQWCERMESFHDFENRLPRGRTYTRNGSVCHLGIKQGRVEAFVVGSEMYEITVDIKTIPKQRWAKIKKACVGRIGSLLELLQGRLSDEVMEIVTNSDNGLLPGPKEISFDCDCPDWATMCKHVAAVFYGIGARLDSQPELLFVLRGVDHEELLTINTDTVDAMTASVDTDTSKTINDGDLADIFGIDIANTEDLPSKPSAKKKATKKKATKEKVTKKKATKKKVTKKKATKKKATKKKATKKKATKKKATKKKATKKKATKKKGPRSRS